MPPTADEATAVPQPRVLLLLDRVVGGIAMLFLLVDAGGKLLAPQMMIDTTPAGLQLPHDVDLYRMLRGILTACIALHLWPRTALLGAVLATAYMGGAVVVNVRAQMPLFTNTLFGIYVGVAMWVGFYLRDARLRPAFA